MRPHAYTVIKEEHQALAAMLRSLLLLLAQSRREGRPPDFGVLRAMLFYIDEFPERLHHTKESQLLFPQLRARVPGLAEVLDRLDREHGNGERAIRHLEHLMLAYEVMGEPRREAFEVAAARYVEFYLEHMGIEEQTVLPAALAHLAPEDWAALDAAFARNRDPLAGHGSLEDYQGVVQTILNRAPAPVGLG
ncbi:hemerythrin domain-containing protein [Ideonella livida]|uniref:Hemerythrin domain-containing protein n=1 Tax=Ideonella livida TaxID=2707176 RepID=A0A7C9TKI3_9BURK|nr:hemerythrin domain-containing protein [Ideonella livida]NDY92741.1 hemerythrin domain-containing protein [Ideonella livida]